VYNNSTGKITVSGTAKITAATSGTTVGTITLASSGTDTADRLIIQGGTIENTNVAGFYAIQNASTGGINISGGTVSSTAGRAINITSTGKITISGTALVTARNDNTGAGTIFLASVGTDTADRLVISGGTVRNTGSGNAIRNDSTAGISITGGTIEITSTGTASRAIFNNSSGALKISGGTVQATAGSAIINVSTGKITVSGSATITSASASVELGTIVMLKPAPDDTNVRFEMTGGTVRNTSTTGNAIYSASTGAITISRGTVTAAATSFAVRNTAGGAVNTTGATVTGRVGQ